MDRPAIRSKKSFGLDDCPEVPTWEAGYLVGGNGDWRSVRPVVDLDACAGCLQCYLYCPDGAISKHAAGQGARPKVGVDYDFCKGCGICVKICRFGALHMEEERR